MLTSTFIIRTLIICFISCGLFPLIAAEENSMDFSFFYKDKEEQIKTVDLNAKTVTLNAGDKLKFYYEPVSKLHFYIYHVDRDNVITLIFPPDFNFHNREGAAYYIPKGNPKTAVIEWFTLFGQGPEVFYIIASPTPLTTLEVKNRHYMNRQNEKNTNALLRHLESIDKFANDGVEPREETIAGTAKASEFMVYTITFGDLYVKKITLLY